jgi:hypothetical protein
MGVSFPAVFPVDEVDTKHRGTLALPARGLDLHCIDPGAQRAAERLGGRVGTGSDEPAPLRLNCRVGSVADVTDFEARGPQADNGPTDDSFAEAYGDDIQAIEAELAEAKARVAEVPAQVVVMNHAMGLYELGAIHLSAVPPRLGEAVLAIDAFACLVEGLGERLGEEAPMLQQALQQIRLAFVQIKAANAE